MALFTAGSAARPDRGPWFLIRLRAVYQSELEGASAPPKNATPPPAPQLLRSCAKLCKKERGIVVQTRQGAVSRSALAVVILLLFGLGQHRRPRFHGNRKNDPARQARAKGIGRKERRRGNPH